MAQIPDQLGRWLVTSLATYFKPVADGLSLPYYIDGLDERSDEIVHADHAEMRFTGPFIYERSKDYYKIQMVVNILLTRFMGMQSNSYYLVDWAGVFQQSMLTPLPVYKWGSGDDLLGCLMLENGAESVKIFHFGQISTTDRLRQSEVDALYRMELKV
jgi:hypothetical protein